VANIAQSAPVYDEAQQKFVGIVDMRDLVAAVVWDYSEAKARAAAEGTDNSVDRVLKATAAMHGVPHEELTLQALIKQDRGLQSVPESASLDDVTKLLMAKGCHRVAVVNDAGKVVTIISQSQIIR
jgi:CBS-domain-containing membrane protein